MRNPSDAWGAEEADAQYLVFNIEACERGTTLLRAVFWRRASSSKIFCTMKVATVLESSLPISIVRKHSGIISVLSRKLITSVSST